MQALLELTAAALGVLLLVAALGKLDSWSRWSATVTTLVPGHPAVARALRSVLPVAEAVIGTLCFARAVLGLACGAALLLVLAAGVAWLTPQQAGADCGCFGALMPSKIGRALALRDAAVGVVVGLAAVEGIRAGIEPLRPLEIVVAGLVGVHVVLLGELRRMPRDLLRG